VDAGDTSELCTFGGDHFDPITVGHPAWAMCAGSRFCRLALAMAARREYLLAGADSPEAAARLSVHVNTVR
jgi:hypothetical protein